MNTLEIAVQRKIGDGWPVVAEYSRPDRLPVRSEELLELPHGWQDELRDLSGEPVSYGTVLGRARNRSPGLWYTGRLWRAGESGESAGVQRRAGCPVDNAR